MSWRRLGILPTVLTGLVVLALLVWPVLTSVRVIAAPPTQEGQATITAPQSGSQVGGTIQITGSATHPQFHRYELAWASEPITGDSWAVFATIEAQIENGILGTWNTAQVPDGSYSLRLRVVRQDSNYAEVVVTSIQVVNSRPLETPTLSIGPTIPPEETLVPGTPTPELIMQPPTSTPQPPTSTPAGSNADSGGSNALSPTSFNVNLGALGEAFCNGVTWTFGLFVLWGVVLSIRSIARWALQRMARQGNKGTE